MLKKKGKAILTVSSTYLSEISKERDRSYVSCNEICNCRINKKL